MSGEWVIGRLGMVAACGDSPGELAQKLSDGRPLHHDGPAGEAPVAPATSLDSPAVPLTAAIEGFNPKRYIERRGLKDLSRTSQLACAAAAPIAATLGDLPATDVGVILGTAWGSLRSVVDFEWESCTTPVRLVNPLLFAETVSNVPAGQISIIFGWSAFNLTVSSGSASGLGAIREGLELLREGRASLVVAGGADELNLPALQVLAEDGVATGSPGSLPFSDGRSGLVGGEGACLITLESRRGAEARGVRPLARLRAALGRFVPHAVTDVASRTRSLADLLRELLDAGGTNPDDVQLIVASANGMPDDDRIEAEAIDRLFGGSEAAPAVIAPKGILGETWGASGPLGVAAACESIRTGIIPPRPHGLVTDRSLPRLHLPERPTKRSIRNAVVIGSTGSGHLEALLISPGDSYDRE